MNEQFTILEFNYASIQMAPYTGGNGTSTQLLKDIIHKLNDKEFPNEKRIINRHKDRKKSPKREIVFISSPFEIEGKRCFGKIALIKNKTPFLWGGKDIIEEIEKIENKKFIEITNFAIHFNDNADPIIMHEFNSEGPRLSDIEFYIRQIAKEFLLAKNIKTILHLDTNYEQLERDMKNIFGVTFKVKAALTNRFNWFQAFKSINEDSGFNDVRLEFFFKRKKLPNGEYERNIRGTGFARNILSWLSKDRNNIHYLEDLKMKYQLSNSDDIIDLDFLKNKMVSIINIPRIEGKKFSATEYKFIVGQEFNTYLKTGKTNK